MAAGVHRIRGLTEPMPSMADQTDVGMERVDLGQMTSTESQVCFFFIYIFQKCILRPSKTGNIFVQLIWRNIVALQVERVVAPIATACSTCHPTNSSVASCSNMLHKIGPSSTFCNNFFQLATLKFVAWKVEHVVVIRATTR